MSTTVLLERSLRPHHLPLILGKSDGLFEERSLEVTLLEPSEGTVGLNPLYEGEADYALASPLRLVHDDLRGHDPVGVGRIFHSETGILYRTDGELTSPDDLGSNHTLAVRGIEDELAAGLLAAMADRDPASSGEGPERIPASGRPAEDLLEGRADALMTAALNLEGVQLQQSDHPVDFWFLDDHGLPPDNDIVVVTTRKRVDENPGQVQGLLSVLHEALGVVREDTDRARDLYRQRTDDRRDVPGGRPLLFTTLSELTSDFSQDFENYIAWGEFLREELEVEGFLDVDRLVDERLLPLEAMNL